MVVSGFLGAGKTTTMVALTEYINSTGKSAAIIANDWVQTTSSMRNIPVVRMWK